MNFRVDVYHHFEPADGVAGQLNQILTLLTAIKAEEDTMTPQLTALQAQVSANNDLTASAVALIQGLAAQIEAAKDDPLALQALADSLKASDDSLAASLAANTPAAPTV